MSRPIRSVLVLAGIAALVASCGSGGDDAELATLAGWMTGRFSSAEQAAADSTFFDVRLLMAPIWTEWTDGHWFYVEQAIAGHMEQPYRQRVYHLQVASPGSYASEVYTLPAPHRFIGNGTEAPIRSSALTPDSLGLREGCTILLRRENADAFVGGTQGEGCASSLRGAAYATSEVTVTAGAVISWDRGFDAGGEQVWGATKGGYVFEKLASE